MTKVVCRHVPPTNLKIALEVGGIYNTIYLNPANNFLFVVDGEGNMIPFSEENFEPLDKERIKFLDELIRITS
jgi:hypothetical protein